MHRIGILANVKHSGLVRAALLTPSLSILRQIKTCGSRHQCTRCQRYNAFLRNQDGQTMSAALPSDYNGTGSFSLYSDGVLVYTWTAGTVGGENPPAWVGITGIELITIMPRVDCQLLVVAGTAKGFVVSASETRSCFPCPLRSQRRWCRHVLRRCFCK